MANNSTMPIDPVIIVNIFQSSSAMLIMGLCFLIVCHCLIAIYVALSHQTAPPIHVEIVCPAANPSDDEELCYACVDSKPDTMLLACGHQGLCTSCARQLWRIDRRCPLCRAALKGMVFLN
jgi:hypothetical protein